ncbi:Acetyl-coenzyme A synthetase [Rhodovastum atsumiense]|uniref:AMP-binding protein n=1 Tax=Rhodovastum atsumiense TaxID=504468 RepID=A0A5M6IQQ5_9PROT|nr:AMP-binding protein [Rhodovastum atsumiense]KAA5610606.1 AMP-binding protein [Rhodovastum atsumiense]CAH2600724.1 Acetyl-coenzyme A synthetase [Rhodovastum atsumiense]
MSEYAQGPGHPPRGPDYQDAVAAFRLQALAASLRGSLETGLNACVECCDRHADDPTRIALLWESHDGRSETLTFAALKERAARFAGFLRARGVQPGEVVAGMLPRVPDLLAVILGTWRAGAVYQPLFTAFGPKAIEQRLQTSGAMLVVTDPVNRPKLDEIPGAPPVAVIGGTGIRAGDFDLAAELARQAPEFAPVPRRGEDLFLMLSTSGTTGLPKGVPVPLKALLSFAVYMRDAVDLRPEDRFWNIADPGWAYGLYYAVTGPLLLGHATTFYDGPFTVESTYRLIAKHGITNLAGAPTAYRLLIAAGPEAARPVKGQLRAVSSAGEPLNPEVIRWFAEHLAAPIYDHYGQTELGMVVCNHHALSHPVRPGSAGLAMPGYRVAVLDEQNRELPPHQPGVLAIDMTRSPLLWFGGYWQQPTPAIEGGYYRTGDVVELGEDGSIAFVGRADDVITSAGYRIGPFDVESALIEHPAVIEAAVVGKPDPERTEIVKAFVVLADGYAPSEELGEELRQHVKRRLSAHAYPREVAFVPSLPKTPSGKLQRFMLRNQEVAASRPVSA